MQVVYLVAGNSPQYEWFSLNGSETSHVVLGVGDAVGMPELILMFVAFGLVALLLRVANPWIHWDEIEGAWQPRNERGDRLRLRLRVSERLSPRLRRRSGDHRLPASVEVPVDLTGTHLSGVELLQEIVAHSSD